MLRLWAMDESGKPLNPKEQGMLRNFKAEMNANDVLVQYDPSHARGPWLCVARRPGIDTGFVRNPEAP